ncbi:hypothetical protein GCM10020227_05550 [Streptomyces flavovirens]
MAGSIPRRWRTGFAGGLMSIDARKYQFNVVRKQRPPSIVQSLPACGASLSTVQQGVDKADKVPLDARGAGTVQAGKTKRGEKQACN